MNRLVCLGIVASTFLFFSEMYSELRTITNALYFTGSCGVNWIQDQIHHEEYNFRMGPTAGLSVGYKFHCGFRVEAEYAYRYNRFNHVEIYSQKYSRHGYFQTSAGLCNVLYDFWIQDTFGVPYMGIGLGVANQRLVIRDHSRFRNPARNSLAWQAILGFDYIINSYNRAGVCYKFFRGAGFKLNGHALVFTWTYFPKSF